jgi:hypothetical protein
LTKVTDPHQSVTNQLALFPLVCVLWRDSCSIYSGWQEYTKEAVDDLHNKAGLIYSIGFLTHHDEDNIYITGSVGASPKEDGGLLTHDTMAIPIRCILAGNAYGLKAIADSMTSVEDMLDLVINGPKKNRKK